MMIVDRHPGMGTQGMTSARRDDRVPRHDPGRNSPIVMPFRTIATSTDQQTAIERLYFEKRHPIFFIVLVAAAACEQWVLLEGVAVQPGNVARINPALECLQVVALLQSFRDKELTR